jgi:hypothetical protein
MWRAIFSTLLQQTLYFIFIFIKIIFLLFYLNFFFSLLISLFFFVSPPSCKPNIQNLATTTTPPRCKQQTQHPKSTIPKSKSKVIQNNQIKIKVSKQTTTPPRSANPSPFPTVNHHATTLRSRSA